MIIFLQKTNLDHDSCEYAFRQAQHLKEKPLKKEPITIIIIIIIIITITAIINILVLHLFIIFLIVVTGFVLAVAVFSAVMIDACSEGLFREHA